MTRHHRIHIGHIVHCTHCFCWCCVAYDSCAQTWLGTTQLSFNITRTREVFYIVAKTPTSQALENLAGCRRLALARSAATWTALTNAAHHRSEGWKRGRAALEWQPELTIASLRKELDTRSNGPTCKNNTCHRMQEYWLV